MLQQKKDFVSNNKQNKLKPNTQDSQQGINKFTPKLSVTKSLLSKNIQTQSAQKEEEKEDNTLEKQQKFRILEPFRNIGKVIDKNHPCFFKRTNQRFFICSNNYSFCLYNLEKLRIERISPSFNSIITAFAHYKNKIFVSSKNKIYLFEKIHILNEYTHEYDIEKLYVYESVLLALDSQGSIIILKIHSLELIKYLKLNIDVLIHPTTYLNIIAFTPKNTLVLNESEESYNNLKNISNNLLESEDVTALMQQHNLFLFDINSEKTIFSKQVLPKNSLSTDSADNSITVLEQSPIIDVIALGYALGQIVCINLKKDFREIKSFYCQSKIVSLTFSDCFSMKTPILISSEENKTVSIWGLDKSILLYSFPSNFTGNCLVDNVMFIPNEPLLLLTSEEGNYIKEFYFNENQDFASPKLLKERIGFIDTPKKLRFYGEDEKHLIALSNTQLKYVSTINEHISKEFSIKKLLDLNININFSNFDANYYRERDWSNVLVINKQVPYTNKSLYSYNVLSTNKIPLLFSTENKNMSSNKEASKNLLTGITNDYGFFNESEQEITSICISFCGKFGFIGYSKGLIVKFSMQSGLVKKVVDNKESLNKNISKDEISQITSIKTDGLNSVIITINKNKKLTWWDFLTLQKIKEITLPFQPALLELEKTKDLITVALENNEVYLYNKTNFKKIRKISLNELSIFDLNQMFKLSNKEDNINTCIVNDITFGNNGDWVILITSTKFLIIFDIKTSLIIENIQFEKEPISVTCSANDVLVAITFENENYIHLMINREKYVDSINDSQANMYNVLNKITSNRSLSVDKFNKKSNGNNNDNYNFDSNIEPIILKDNSMFVNQVKYTLSREALSRKEKEKALKEDENLNVKKLNLPGFKNKEEYELIELSDQNKTKYRQIVFYDLLSKNNKPNIAHKEKTQAPFFLFDINNEDAVVKNNTHDPKSRDKAKANPENDSIDNLLARSTFFKEEVNKNLINNNKVKNTSDKFSFKLIKLLEKLESGEISSKSITIYLNTLSPELLDVEIRSLTPELNNNSNHSVNSFIKNYLFNEINSNSSFELVQAYMNRFLKVFGEAMIEDPKFLGEDTKEKLSIIRKNINKQKQGLDKIFKHCMCLVSSIGNIQLS